METVSVKAENGSYDILIGENLLPQEFGFQKIALITDDIVDGFYGKLVDADVKIVLKNGEEAKSMANLEMIYDRLLEAGIDRGDAVVALGGGVVGDIAGFAAATFKRGTNFIQIPTTLLAQVDSSVGGKVAVNLDGGKNMVGAFYQPSLVLADTGTLQTLPQRQYAAGMAEVIKYGYIYDNGMFDLIRSRCLEKIVARCCEIKADYVQKDPYDKGVRMQLNYGHTIGHAIETAAGYGHFLHGEAVAIGMVFAAAIGEKLGVSPVGLRSHTEAVCAEQQLPITVQKDILEKALDYLGVDKKAENGAVSFVLVDKIGHAVLEKIQVADVQKICKELFL